MIWGHRGNSRRHTWTHANMKRKRIAKPAKGYVYVIGFCGQAQWPVKIGYTNNVRTRLAAFQAASPFEMTVDLLIEFPTKTQAFAFEQFLHRILKPFAIHSEWYHLIGETKAIVERFKGQSPGDFCFGDEMEVPVVYAEFPAVFDEMVEWGKGRGWAVKHKDLLADDVEKWSCV